MQFRNNGDSKSLLNVYVRRNTFFGNKIRNYVQRDQDFLVLSGPRKMDFVVLTLDAFNAMEETAYLLSTPANAAKLLESIAQDKAGKVVMKEVDFLDAKNANAKQHKSKKPIQIKEKVLKKSRK